MKKFLAIAAVAAALAACSGSSGDKDEDGDKDGASPAAEASSSPAAPSLLEAAGVSNDGPALGKWKVTTTIVSGAGAGTGSNTVEFCVDKPSSISDAQSQTLPDGAECPVRDFKKDLGGGVTGRMECTIQGMKMEMDLKVAGDFKTAYTTDMSMKMDMSAMPGAGQAGVGSMTQVIKQEAVRLGDC